MMLEKSVHLKKIIAKNFNRAVLTYDKASILQKEIGTRLLEHLELIKINPTTILDLGSGTGFFSNALAKIYPNAYIINLDIADKMIFYAKQIKHSLQQQYFCGDGEYCPIKSQSIDFVFSNCAFQWFLNPQKVLEEIHRILKPNGLLLFSTFGPDTLKELRTSFSNIDNNEHINHFLDMHDMGDIMMQMEFLDPVMNMETITLTYKNVTSLMQDLRLTGSQTVMTINSKGLSTKNILNKLEKAYDIHRTQEGVLPATFEVLYGHAWILPNITLHRANKEGFIYIPADDLPCL